MEACTYMYFIVKGTTKGTDEATHRSVEACTYIYLFTIKILQRILMKMHKAG